ncbi:MAG: MmcQ/YjbR family DNA-binding protein [Flavobacteriales bacterium]
MTTEEFAALALAFPNSEASPHFDRVAFKVIGKRIFATLHEKSNSVNIKLTPTEQIEFCEFQPKAISPVPNKWGEQGWTTFMLSFADEAAIKAALETAYNQVL